METGRAARRRSATGCCRPTPTSAWRRSSRRSGGGANVVVTGRVTDTGLTLGPIFHEFGWSPDDWDKVAAGTVAGHIIECGAQASGGNLLKDWRAVKGLANPGFPIVEASADGSFVVTKHPGTGGVVSVPSVTEQLVYEMGDPHELHHPRRRRRLHHHPAAAGWARPGAGERHRAAAPRPRCSRCPSPTSTATRRWARWCTPGPRRYDKARAADRVLRERLDEPGARVRADPHRVRRGGRHPRPAERRARSRAARGAAADRGARARAGARSSASPARSRRWC